MSKIDVHHHVYPPIFTEVLEAVGGDPSGWYLPSWSAKEDQEFSKSVENGTAILSVTAPGPVIEEDPSKTAALARQMNEYCAKLREDNTSGYGFFASVPSPQDTEICLKEIAYAFDTLHADGVTLFTRYGKGNHYLGHPDFKPIWTELNRRKAVVFIHPTHPVDTNWVNPNCPQPMLDYPHETTRTAMDLIMSNNMRSFPDCKIILSHAGGTLPYLIYRPASMLEHTPFAIGKTREEFLEDGKRFYFDLALSGNPITLQTLLAFAEPGHVLIGTDFPNAPTPGIQYGFEEIEKFVMDEKTRKEIYYGAALKLFPRLAEFYKTG